MRNIVRAVTRNDHKLIDQEMSKLDLADRVGYGIFLRIHYLALSALTGRWNTRDQPDFTGLLVCLVHDLQALNCPVDPVPLVAQGIRTESFRRWGIAYVIRGSRLGGRVLRQRVPAGYPTSYLDSAPSLTWQEFLKQLDAKAQASSSRARAQIIFGAKEAFEAFSTASARCRFASE